MRASQIRTKLRAPFRHGQHVDLRGVEVADTLDLAGCNLSGVDFSGARFLAGLDASRAVFQGLSWFGGAVFAGRCNFSSAVFTNDARFENTVFEQFVDFSGAQFRGIGNFSGAAFRSGVGFGDAVCFGNMSLQEARITAPASMRNGLWLGGLWCDRLHLPADADLSDTIVHGRLWLKGAQLGNARLTTDAFGMSFGYSYD